MVVRCLEEDFPLRVWLSHMLEFSVDGQEGGCCPSLGCVAGEVQEHVGLSLDVEGGSDVDTDFSHVLPQLFDWWHRAQVLDPEARGIRVEPGDLIWDPEAGLSEGLFSIPYRGLASPFEGCRQTCLDVVAYSLIGSKVPRDWGDGSEGRSLASRYMLLGRRRIEEPREVSSE